MINLRISTTENRVTTTVENTAKIAEVLADKDISIQGAAVHLNGVPLSVSDINSATLAELGIEDGATAILSVIVKADSAK